MEELTPFFLALVPFHRPTIATFADKLNSGGTDNGPLPSNIVWPYDLFILSLKAGSKIDPASDSKAPVTLDQSLSSVCSV